MTKKVSILFILFLLSIFSAIYAQDVVLPLSSPQLGTWGDQGDGTYKNPILNSNYPDSDIERFGDKWYMISSKGTYMPGMTILESEDLVNWSITGGIVDKIDWKGTGDGVWAGDLAYHEGYWYCYFIDFGKGLFVTRTRDIKSTWSKSELILEKAGMTDPTVFWDEKKKEAYMICNYHIDRSPNGDRYYIKLFKMDWEGTKIIDDGKLIYSEIGAEAPKVYHINDYFYLFISEWTLDAQKKKDDRKQIVLRSKTIDGPFERRTLLEKDTITGRSSCQGSLIEVAPDEWWYTHQLVQKDDVSYEGRPQFLVPIKWEDDWPTLGRDANNKPIYNTIWHTTKPIAGKAICAPQTDDDFENDNIGKQWLWDGNPMDDKWSLTDEPGSLRLYSCKPRNPKRPYHSLPNKLLQRKMGHGVDTVTIKMNTNNMSIYQKSGLLHIAHNWATVGVEYTKKGKRIFVETPKGKTYGTKISAKEIWLRSIAKENKVIFEYSLDGKKYKPVSKSFEMRSKGFNGIFIGLYSMNNTERGSVDFRWFSYEYDGPKSKKLVIY